MKRLYYKIILVLGISIIFYLIVGFSLQTKRYYIVNGYSPKREITKEYSWGYDNDEILMSNDFNYKYAWFSIIGVFATGIIIISIKELRKKE